MGKSTLVNSLFLTDLYPERIIPSAGGEHQQVLTITICTDVIILILDRVKQTVKIDASTVEIEERGVKLRLTVVDTPGFGDAIDNTDW